VNLTSLRRFGAALVLSFVAAISIVHGASAEAPAPAGSAGLRHGSRANAADGTLIAYDKVTGIYVVPDRKNTYWAGDRFFQYDGGLWLSATAVAGPWKLTPLKEVPEVARDRQGPAKGDVPAKLPSGAEAIFDPRLRAYKVVGKKGVFLYDAHFYRYDGGVWLGSDSDEGPWKPASIKSLPPPLHKSVPAPEAGALVTLPSGEKVVYDAATKLFNLEGKPDTLLFNGMFYEKREDKWFASETGSAGFAETPTAQVPAMVRLKYRKPGDGKGGKDARKDGAAAARPNAKKGQNKNNVAGKQQGNKNAAKSPSATTEDEDNE